MEFENEERDDLILALGEMIRQEESKPGMLNVLKLKQLQQDYELLRIMAQDTDAEIRCDLHVPYKSVCAITLEGDCLTFDSASELVKALSHCSNVEFYPLTNGKIRMTLTYLGMVKNLK